MNETKNKIKTPNMYKVILINDDFTTMDFVVEILTVVFHKTPAEATKIMLNVHEKGKDLVGIYTYDIANTKVNIVNKMAKMKEFPLKITIEIA